MGLMVVDGACITTGVVDLDDGPFGGDAVVGEEGGAWGVAAAVSLLVGEGVVVEAFIAGDEVWRR